MAASEVASFETNFFRIADSSEAETSMGRKAECLLATGEHIPLRYTPLISIYKLSDLGVLSNLIGSLSLAN